MGLLTRILKLKAEEIKNRFKEKPQRQDLSLPLGIRVGSTVQFDETVFILADGQLEFQPPKGRCICQGYGKFTIDSYGDYRIGSFEYFRFYLQDEADNAFVLQVGMIEGKPAEFLLYQPYSHPEHCPDGEIFPASGEDWDAWTDKETGMIGLKWLEIPSGTTYDRIILPNTEGRVEPASYREKAAFDEFGTPKAIADLLGMPYGRTIETPGGDVKEFALPEKRVDADGSGACITVMVGVEFDQVSIRVL